MSTIRSTILSASILFSTLLSTPAAAQLDPQRFLPPIIALILFEHEEFSCPESVAEGQIVTGDQNISSQMQLDLLDGVTQIDGSLNFSLSIATNYDLTPLRSLLEVTGSVNIQNTQLTEMTGFGCLTSIGGDINVSGNLQLETLTAFDALASLLGEIVISGNDDLTRIPEFDALTTLSGDLIIDSNNELASINGFASLASIQGDLQIVSNAALTDFSGFAVLSSVQGELAILSNNSITNLSGFDALISAGDVTIGSNPAVLTISALTSLNAISNDLTILNNSSLTEISGFDLLTSEGVSGDSLIVFNVEYDCTNPAPTFSPVTTSTGNFMDCVTSSDAG